MLTSSDYPILEHDDSAAATLNPSSLGLAPFDTNKLVITFFREAMDRLLADGTVIPERTIPGEVPLPVYRFAGSDVLITLGFVGCPSCAGDLDLFHALGVNKVMFCGGGGVLDGSIGVGTLLLVDGAIRDEGFSYHYLPPSRTVEADPTVTARIAAHLDECGIPYKRGLCWTTDAIFRETPDRVARRRAEGALIVEMEQAGCLAVARFRGFDYGALIYGGDDLSGSAWDDRSWRSREGIRYDMIRLCRELVEIL